MLRRYSSSRYSNPARPSRPVGCDNLPPLGFDVLVEPAYPYGTKGAGSPLLATSHTSSANDPMCHVRGFTASSPCVCPSTHAGGIRVPTHTTCSCTRTGRYVA